MSHAITIDRHQIGRDHPTFVIAEAGVNHDGNPALALELVRAAKRAGADCVKFQTFKAERVVSDDAPKADYQLRVTDLAESQLSMLRSLELPEQVYGDLVALCTSEDIVFTSTPYNEEDIDFLVELGVPLLKSASIHMAEPRFLQTMAETGRPLVVSTGMCDWAEVDRAVAAIRSTGNEDFVLLQCTTNYPSAIDDVNLRAMVSMAARYGCLAGYSDHTQSQVPCLGAVALGATVIEKHLTLDVARPGPDHATSENPESFAQLVEGIRTMERALGRAEKMPTAAERLNMPGMRRSIVARQAIARGQVVADGDLICKRPMGGIPPHDWDRLVGRVAGRDIRAGEVLSWDDFGG